MKMTSKSFSMLALSLGALSAIGLWGQAKPAEAAPNSVSDKGSVSQRSNIAGSKQNANAEKIQINGLQGGQLIQSGNKVIVRGGTIVAKPGESKPAIQIENPRNKEVVIENTRIISDGAVQNNKDGNAGIVIIENGKQVAGNSNSRIKINNVEVKARNSTIRAQASGGQSVCAGVVCTGFGDNDDENNTIIEIRGNNTFEAISK